MIQTRFEGAHRALKSLLFIFHSRIELIRYRLKSHSGAVRKSGEDVFTPVGPHNMTPSYSSLCSRCNKKDDHTSDEEDQDTVEDIFIITDSMIMEVGEEEDSEEDDTLEMLDISIFEFDSGLDSSDEDEDFELFARD